MHRSILVAVVVWVAAASAPAAEFAFNGQRFTLPDGFALERAAGPPLVDRPISADFDEQGRLYVTESSGSNDKVTKQLAEKPHRILRLVDTDGDGRFDSRTVYAEGLMFPEGALWHDGSLYVAAPPQIWKFTDTDDDGVADQREVWFDAKTLTGCANDLHGPYLGPDGWIYWAKGAFAEQTYERPGKPPLVTRASHLFRRHPNGGPVEPVMTGGMDNPVEVVFTPGGERIFTTTFLQHPGGGRRDGLIHAVYGGVYGKSHRVLDGHPRTGDLMPVLTHLGAAAPCGLAHLESDQLGPDFRHNLLAALFNMKKITRHVLAPSGATFQSHDSDLLVCDSRDFHPTDVLEDADGSVIVLDTGGWYKLCCPTSQLWKPEVLGAIYRIRRIGSHRVADPRGQSLEWAGATTEALTHRLADARPAVRKRAMQALAQRGQQAVPALRDVVRNGADADARRAAVWTLSRIAEPGARAAIRAALVDTDADVRQAAIHAVSVRRDHQALDQLCALLDSPSRHNRRAAAEALGRIGDPAAVPALLAAARAPHGRALEHSLVYALIEIAAPAATRAGLAAAPPLTHRAALIALDQMAGGELTPDDIKPLLASSEAALRHVASWILTHHPEWAPAFADVVRARLRDDDLTEPASADLTQQLVQFVRDARIQELMAAALGDDAVKVEAKRATLRAMARSGLKTMPARWSPALAALLAKRDGRLTGDVVAAARALPAPKGDAGALQAGLMRIAQQPERAAGVRLEALAAVPHLPRIAPALFRFVVAHLPPDIPVRNRTFAADVLARAKLSAEQLDKLADTVPIVSPLELERLLAAFAQSHDEHVGRKLVDALRNATAAPALDLEKLEARFAGFGAAVQQQAKSLRAELTARNAAHKAALEKLLASLEPGDIARGQNVFNSAKAACRSCHAMGYLGGTVGPDLTRIGRIRTRQDLLEAIILPSASFVRSYEPVQVLTTNGQAFNGVLRQDTHEEVILATGPTDEETRIPRDQIEVLQAGKVSVMPAGMDKQLSRRELADLIAFLQAAR